MLGAIREWRLSLEAKATANKTRQLHLQPVLLVAPTDISTTATSALQLLVLVLLMLMLLLLILTNAHDSMT